MSGLNTAALIDDLVTHALTLGVFDSVNAHEPATAPGLGVQANIFADYIGPMPTTSGLSATTALVVMNERLVTSMAHQPADDIDSNLANALDALFAAYHADFELGGDVMAIDLLGASRYRLEAHWGYFHQGDTTYRAILATVPLIVPDAWTQSAA